MILTNYSRPLGFLRSMIFYKVVMAILILGLSFIPCKSSKLNVEESLIVLQLHRQGSSVASSLVCASGGDDPIGPQCVPAIKGRFPARFTGNRRMLGENFAEKNVGEDEKPLSRAHNRINLEGSGHENKMERPHHHNHHRRQLRGQAGHEAISLRSKKRHLQVSGSTAVVVHEEPSRTHERNSLATNKTDAVSWHKPGEKYDEPTFHVDYSGPKTHPPKNN